jgi:hypothetical protein
VHGGPHSALAAHEVEEVHEALALVASAGEPSISNASQPVSLNATRASIPSPSSG